MKITGSSPNYINQAYASQVANSRENTPKNAHENRSLMEGDNISLSQKTRDLQSIHRAIDIEPADRTDRLESIKKQIQANQYTINAEQIAEKMIGSRMDGMV